MRRRKRNYGSVLFMLVLVALIAGGVFVATSKMFEREAPVIALDENGFWNLQVPIALTMSDESGIREYRVSLKLPEETIELAHEKLLQPEHEVTLKIEAPKKILRTSADAVTIVVEATDASRWNLLAGNAARSETTLQIDTRHPNVSIISNSYAITRGGAALVIFQAEDEHMDELYLLALDGKKFKPQPFYKEGFYASLVAWPVTEESFRISVVATDLAGNQTKKSVPYYLKDRRYRVSNIKLSDKFLNGKIADLAYEYFLENDEGARIDQFKKINEEVRAKNEALIHEVTSKVSDTMIDSFSILPFYPLKNGKNVASFGDHRIYYYDGRKVSESYHLGLDLASVQMGKIRTQNPGKTVFSDQNGIYGNMPVIDHGLGLYTLYGHCSSVHVNPGDDVGAGAHIANTGMSGYAMGDHLHFGVLVQGVEVRPEEWMDKNWIRLNVTDVMNEAKKIIKRRQ